MLDRRDLLAAGGALLAAGTVARPGTAAAHDAAVAEGIAWFRRRAADQLPLVRAMERAIAAGDLAAARAAYVDARPPYEEIEVLALCFEESDSAIDARPYAFDDGETSADFRGFHRIEALLFRDDDLRAAAPWAGDLVGWCERLERELGEPERFSAGQTFDGMLGLATEIGAKKISSEEETWSDQSLVIFKHNWLGIHSQYRPFAAAVAAKQPAVAAAVERTNAAALATVAPFFKAGVVAGRPYSEVRTAERRAISAAAYAYRDALAAAREALGIG
jgi:iron uptake system component EfeO